MLPQQLDELRSDEGLRLFCYDDATGAPIRPGSVVKGHPTIGVGRACDVHGISADEARQLLINDVVDVETALSRLDWFQRLDPVRRGVMVNLGFNLGVRGLESFTRMIAAVETGEHDLSVSMSAMAQHDFDAAANELARSKWAGQVQASRRDRLLAQLRSGKLDPPTDMGISIPPAAVQAPAAVSEVDRLNQAEIDRHKGDR